MRKWWHRLKLLVLMLVICLPLYLVYLTFTLLQWLAEQATDTRDFFKQFFLPEWSHGWIKDEGSDK